MAAKTLRIGLVGAGANTRQMHLPGLQKLPGVEVVAVCNRSRESSAAVARDFKIPRVADHWTEVVADPEIDALAIGTWPYLHAPVTIAALEAGKHVLCEARMALNAAEAHAMNEAARWRPHLVAQLVPSPMTLAYDGMLRHQIAAGYLGDVLVVEIVDRGAFADPSAPLHWRQDFALSGYNTMALGIWYEALLRWVGEALEVRALSRTFVPTRLDQNGERQAVRVPDHVDVLGTMDCGAQLHLQCSAVMGLATPSSAVWLHGSEGTLHLDPASGILRGARRGESELREIAIPAELRGGWRVEEEWVNAILGKEEVQLTTFPVGVKYMEFTEAVALSARSGRAVPLPLVRGENSC